MRRRVRILVPLALVAALGVLVAGCGGGSSDKVPAGAIAKVGDETISRSQLNDLVARAQRSYKLQKRPFPKAGTPDYLLLQQQYVTALVNQAEIEQRAKEMGVKVTDKQVDQRIAQYKKQSLGGSEKRYLQTLKTYGLTQADARDLFRQQLLSDAVYGKVTKDVKVSDKAVEQYYKAHPEQYAQPKSRQVRHILVKTKAKAEQVRKQLVADDEKNFAALAKKDSIDPGSKSQGGKLTVLKGQTVPEFDKVAFQLKTGELSQPVHTQYGWHLIQALGDVKPEKKTPLSQVKDSIRQQLLQQKRSQVVTKWINDLKDEFEGKVRYATGFAPPATTATSVPSVSVATSTSSPANQK